MIEDTIIDEIDCMVQRFKLKKEAREFSTDVLVNYIAECENFFQINEDFDEIVLNYWNDSLISKVDREMLEDLYVLMKVTCIGEDGVIYLTAFTM